MSKEERKIKYKQYILAIITLIIFTLIAALFVFGGVQGEKEQSNLQKIEITNPSEAVSLQDRWLAEAENKLDEIDKQRQDYKQTTNLFENRLNNIEQKFTENSTSNNPKNQQEIDALKQQIEEMRLEMDNLRSTNIVTKNQPYMQSNIDNNLGINNDNLMADISKIEEVKFKLQDDNNFLSNNKRDLKIYLPSGSYAPAIIISGVDASVGVNSQTDPRPVLFRITGEAVNAMHNNVKQKIDLSGCIVTGAASGDLSAEKIFVRLLKMSCAPEEGKIVETDIEGYASAKGKAGIRGEVVSREGDLVTKSFFAGLVGQVGSGVSQSLSTPIALPSGLTTQRPQINEIVGSGIGKGVNDSGNKIADYLIERAEQYQPVITIPSGIEVELVFHKGIYLDGRKLNNKEQNS